MHLWLIHEECRNECIELHWLTHTDTIHPWKKTTSKCRYNNDSILQEFFGVIKTETCEYETVGKEIEDNMVEKGIFPVKHSVAVGRWSRQKGSGGTWRNTLDALGVTRLMPERGSQSHKIKCMKSYMCGKCERGFEITLVWHAVNSGPYET